MEVNHSHIFWSCTKLKPFWDNVNVTIHYGICLPRERLGVGTKERKISGKNITFSRQKSENKNPQGKSDGLRLPEISDKRKVDTPKS